MTGRLPWLPTAEAAAEGDVARRVAMLRLVMGVVAVGSSAFAITLFAQGRPILAGMLAAHLPATLAALILIRRRPGQRVAATNLFIAGVFVTLSLLSTQMDGLRSPALPTLVLLPMLAVFVGSRRSGVAWTVASVAVIAVVGVASLTGWQPGLAIGREAAYMVAGVAALVRIAAAYLLAESFDRARADSHAAVDAQLEELRRSVEPLEQVPEEMRSRAASLSGDSSLLTTMEQHQGRGGESLRAAQEQLAELMRQFEAVGQQVAGLREDAGEVGQVADTVERLARKLDLVALNSRLYSVQRGDAAAGFGIVATEVARLAERVSEESSRSTVPLRRMKAAAEQVEAAGAEGIALARQGEASLARLSESANAALMEAGRLRAEAASLGSYASRQIDAVGELAREPEREEVRARGGWLGRALAWLAGRRVARGSSERARQARLTAGYAVSIGLTIGAFSVIFLWVGHVQLASVALSAVAGGAASVLVLRWSGNLPLASHLFGVAIWVIFVVAALMMGGLWSASVPPLTLLPMITTFMAGPRVGRLWLAASLLAVAGLMLASVWDGPPVSDLDETATRYTLTAAWMAIVVIGFLMALSFDVSRTNAARRVQTRTEAMRRLLSDLGELHEVVEERAVGIAGRRGAIAAMSESARRGREAMEGIAASLGQTLERFVALSEGAAVLRAQARELADVVAQLDRASTRLGLVAVSAHIEASRARSAVELAEVAAEMSRLAEVVRLDTERSRGPLARLLKTSEAAWEAGKLGVELAESGQVTVEQLQESLDGGLRAAEELGWVAAALAGDVRESSGRVREAVAVARMDRDAAAEPLGADDDGFGNFGVGAMSPVRR